MVDESDRIWLNLDDIRGTISDHCIRLTKLEAHHYEKDKSRSWNLTLLLGALVVLQFGFLIYERISMP